MNTQKPQPECPECERLTQVSDESNKIGEFLEWLEERATICEWTGGYPDSYHPTNKPIEQWLAEYYNIDLNKVEAERRVLLEWLREVQDGQ